MAVKEGEESADAIGGGAPAAAAGAGAGADAGAGAIGKIGAAASPVPGVDQECDPALETVVLLDSVIHDLRTPLSAMSGWLEVLEAHFDDAQGLVARALVGLRRGVDSQTDSLNRMSDVLMKQRLELPETGECVLLERLQAALGRMAHRDPPMSPALSARLTPISRLAPDNSLTCKDAGSSLDDACETLLHALALSQGTADEPLSVAAAADRVLIAVPGASGDPLPLRSLCYGLAGRARHAEIRPQILWLARSMFQRCGVALRTVPAVGGGFSLLASRRADV